MSAEELGRSIPGLSYAPGQVLGHRADGRPIYPIAGGRQQRGEPGGGTAAPPAPPVPPAPPEGEVSERNGRTATGALTLTHPQCVNRLQDIRLQMGQIAELRTPTAEDDAYFRELAEEFEEVDEYRQRLERDATLARISNVTGGLSTAGYLRTERGAFGGRSNSQAGSGDYDVDSFRHPDSVEEMRFRNPWDVSEVRMFGRSPEQLGQEWRARALSACERMQGASADIRQAATKIIERWDDQDGHLSQLALALSDPSYLRAWSKLARADGNAADLDEAERAAVSRVKTVQRQTRAMSLTDGAGGYLVPFQLDPTVIIAANGSVNEIRQVARQVVAIGDVWNGVSSGAVSWSYDAEAAEVSDDTTTFTQPSIPIYKAQGFVPISVEALQDAQNVAQEVGSLLAFGRDVLEAASFATGSGVSCPTGIVTALVAAAPAVIVTSTGADTFAVGDVYKIQGSLPGRYRSQAAWLANNLTFNMIRAFGTDYAMWGDMGGGMPPLLLGKRALESEDMDGAITGGAENYMAVYGDFSNYVIADRIGMTVEFIPHLFHTGNNRPSGQRGWLAYVRHGADSVNDAAFRLFNCT